MFKNRTLHLFTFILLFTLAINAQEQSFHYADNWGDAGYTVVNKKASSLEIVYSINNLTITDSSINGETLKNVSIPGIFLFNDAGMPDLPGNGKYIAIPEGAETSLTVIDYTIEKYQNIDLAPAPIIPFDTEIELRYERNNKVYSKNAFYPENPFKLSEKTKLRGVDVVMLGVTPFQYNPQTKELLVYRDIRFEIGFNGGSNQFGENRLRNRWWDPILDDALLNYASLPQVDYSKNTSVNGEYEYVILTLDDPDFTQWAETIAEFRREQGISTGVFTISDIPGGNDVNSIETWIDDIYNNWTTPPVAVLILADYGTGADGITSKSYPHPYSGDYISDNHYADVDNDDLPDIAFARITANDVSQLEIMINKFLYYESNPPTSADFYNHPISALGWQTERWFQICSESVKGFWENELGKEPITINNIYEGTPSTSWSSATNTSTVVTYFGQDGLGYLPELPSDLGGNEYWDNGSATEVTNAINNGSFILQHRDHGFEMGWGEPAYGNSNIDNLNNTDLTYIMSINCLTGRFDYGSEVFAEKFHRHTSDGNPSGALGVLAASQVSYSFVNDTFVWGAYDNMWPDFMPGETSNPESRMILPAFANVAGKNFLQQSNWPYNPSSKQITHRLFHHHGDAFLNVYSEVPQNLVVNAATEHVFGNPQFDVTVDEGAFIALTYYDTVNQETIIVTTAESSGGVTSLDMTNCPDVGTNLLMTITKQNYFRYSENVLIISPSGPYVIVDSFVINDANNNEADFGESFNLDLKLKNVGTQTSENISVTLTTTDSYVQSLSNATDIPFSDLTPGLTETSSEQFSVELANTIPDQHIIIFDVEITDSATKSSYNSNISFRVNAPILAIESLVIDDATGNADGILDPAETADIIIQATNTGHAAITNVLSVLSTSSIDLTINTATAPILDLNIGETGDFIFNVTAGADVVLGTPAIVINDLTGGIDSQYSNQKEFTIIIGFVPEYCAAGSGNTTDEYIQQVVFVDIDNTSTRGPSYSDYTSISTNITLRESYPITIINGESWALDQMGCWIDWNYDGDFEDADEEFIITYEDDVPSLGLGTGTGTITVPIDAQLGYTTMRLRVLYTGSIIPCGDTGFGEVEDYTVNVLSSTCAEPSDLAVTNITTEAADMSWTANGSESLWNIEYGVENYSLGTGTYVAGMTNPHTQTGLDVNTSYDFYVQADCGGGDVSPWAGPFNFTTQNNIGVAESIVDAHVLMFPNPTTGLVQINNISSINISVSDILGKNLIVYSFNEGTNSINLSNYSAGIYFIKVRLTEEANEAVKTYKLIKE